jgi:hypothetical protein
MRTVKQTKAPSYPAHGRYLQKTDRRLLGLQKDGPIDVPPHIGRASVYSPAQR